MNIPIEVPVRVHGLLYKQVETTDIKEGDLVLDLRDGTYGYCDMVKGDSIAIRDGWVSEVGVPISSVRKLIPTIDGRNMN